MTNTSNQIIEKITALEEEIAEKKKELAQIRRSHTAVEVTNYAFKDRDGNEVTLSDFFGDKKELILVYNMGKSCRYCTLWADGFIGLKNHLENRAAFVVVSPDAPEVQKEFADSRNWNFKMYSHQGSSFCADMGMDTDKGYVMPGVSTFTKDNDNRIWHNAQTYFGPGDSYNVMWDFMDLLPTGYSDWQPQYTYN